MCAVCETFCSPETETRATSGGQPQTQQPQDQHTEKEQEL